MNNLLFQVCDQNLSDTWQKWNCTEVTHAPIQERLLLNSVSRTLFYKMTPLVPLQLFNHTPITPKALYVSLLNLYPDCIQPYYIIKM